MRSPNGQLKEAQIKAEKKAADEIVAALSQLPADRRLPILKAACILTQTKWPLFVLRGVMGGVGSARGKSAVVVGNRL